jgi:hypothetical protein
MRRPRRTHDEPLLASAAGEGVRAYGVRASSGFPGVVFGVTDSACVANGFPSGSQIRSRNRQSTAHGSVCSFWQHFTITVLVPARKSAVATY